MKFIKRLLSSVVVFLFRGIITASIRQIFNENLVEFSNEGTEPYEQLAERIGREMHKQNFSFRYEKDGKNHMVMYVIKPVAILRLRGELR